MAISTDKKALNTRLSIERVKCPADVLALASGKFMEIIDDFSGSCILLCNFFSYLGIGGGDYLITIQNGKLCIPDDDRFGPLSKSVRKYKYVDEEVDYMCRAVEEYAEKIAKEREKIAVEKAAEEMAIAKSGIVDSLLKEGFPLEKALEMAKIDEETYNSHRIA